MIIQQIVLDIFGVGGTYDILPGDEISRTLTQYIPPKNPGKPSSSYFHPLVYYLPLPLQPIKHG